MLSLRSTDSLRGPAGVARALALATAMLVLAGCAGTSGPRPADESAGAGQEIAPEVLTLFEQATAIMAAGDLVEAEFRFKEFVLQYPGYPGAHTNLAIIHASNGDDQSAEDAITDALLADPEYAPALNQLGMLLRRRGEFAAAESAYQRAVDSDPQYALAHYNLGVLNELYLRKLDVALAHFEAYQSLSGSDDQVEKWIVDLKRRLEAEQRAANVTE